LGLDSGFYFPAIFRLAEAVSNHEERLIQLEARYAWLERHVAEQDKAMAEMADEIRRLRRETDGLRERLVQAAGNDGVSAADEPPPPHY
jgi:SlyX protein